MDRFLRGLCGLSILLLLAGCGIFGHSTPISPQTYQPQNMGPGSAVAPGSLFGSKGLSVDLMGNNRGAGAGAGAALGVNAYLWRGALDTLAFMPLASADPFGGVIITDWWQPPQAPDERFKADCYILGRELSAGALRLSIFRQVMTNGKWADAAVSPGTVSDIENRILDRARTLRAQSATP